LRPQSPLRAWNAQQVFSLGLATIIRHPAGAISAFVGILLVLPVIARSLPANLNQHFARFLPGQIGATMAAGPGSAPTNSFAPWIGFAILCVYAAALLVIGGILLEKRDA
jgi:ABC-2 type transport system permease protein